LIVANHTRSTVLINPPNWLVSPQFLLAILLLVKLSRYPVRIAILVGVGLTQIGEFSFILVQVARSKGLVSEVWCRLIALGFGERRTGSGRSAGTTGDFYPFITEITPPLFGLNRPDPGRTICVALVVLTFRCHGRAQRFGVLFSLRT
jgi:Kef-type K+ transport system membrane component KefB